MSPIYGWWNKSGETRARADEGMRGGGEEEEREDRRRGARGWEEGV